MDRRHFLASLVGGSHEANPLSAATTSLEPWQPTAANPWDRHAAKHLFHRLGIAASKEWLERALSMDPQEYINALLDDALTNELLPEPPIGWEDWLTVPPYAGSDPKVFEHEDDVYHRAKIDMTIHWSNMMADEKLMFRERLVLFWSNHFVVQEQKVYHPQQVYHYLTYLRKNGWSNFKQMVKDISIQPAMLVYLDGVWSEKDKLNENYARELMELFTMGITDRYGNPNYTQKDVRDLALALTGWRFQYGEPPPNVLPPYFAWYYFDFDTKTSPWGVEEKLYGLPSAKKLGLFPTLDEKIEADVIDAMFAARRDQIAWHICKKLYTFFVHRNASSVASEAVIEQLAERFKLDWELKPVIELLIRSEHFFDQVVRGGIVKSPYDFMFSCMNHLNLPVNESRCGTLAWEGKIMNQWLINPVNVKGWPGHRTWLTSGTLIIRLEFLTAILQGNGVESHYVNAHDGLGYEWIVWTDQEVTAWASQFKFYAKDIEGFVNELSQLFFAIEPTSEQLNEIIDRTISFPRYEWPTIPHEQRVPIIKRLVLALMMLPEYQIN
jgi:uncharacterized protein (DUF1800 family)